MLFIDTRTESKVAEPETKRATPPYVPYKTFNNFLNGLRENGLPAQIDRSVLGGMSGSVQSAITSSLEFLQLVDSNGNPTQELHQLVELEEEQRAPILRSVIEKTYPFIFSGSIDLKRATTKQIEDAFRAQGASGSTVVKCIGFFLAAAKAAGITVSPHVKTPTLVRPSPPKRPANHQLDPDVADESQDKARQPIPSDMRQIKLPLIGKSDVILALPQDFTIEDWQFLEPILKAYIDRLLDPMS